MRGDFQLFVEGDAMHIDSASLLTNAALITVGVLAVAFLMWFLVALTGDKNGTSVRCRMEYRIDSAPTDSMDRQPIREVSASRFQSDAELVGLELAPRVLVTHRAVRAVALTPEQDLADESWQAGLT
jgi:hypothetical protein